MRHVRVVWSDKDGAQSVGLWGLHKLLAHDPALGPAVLRALKEWQHGRQCAELWCPSRPYKPTLWAHLGEVGWLGCEDAALWRAWVVGKGGEGRKGGGKHHHHPPPPKKKQRAKPPPPPQSGSGSSRTRTPGPTTPPFPL